MGCYPTSKIRIGRSSIAAFRWMTHNTVAVLDGGWAAWQRLGLPSRRGVESRPRRIFRPNERPELLASSEEVMRWRQDPSYKVFDSRTTGRFRGENETIDPVAGHIPGSVSAPYVEN